MTNLVDKVPLLVASYSQHCWWFEQRSQVGCRNRGRCGDSPPSELLLLGGERRLSGRNDNLTNKNRNESKIIVIIVECLAPGRSNRSRWSPQRRRHCSLWTSTTCRSGFRGGRGNRPVERIVEGSGLL